jgi:hypothetical protein
MKRLHVWVHRVDGSAVFAGDRVRAENTGG